MVIFLPNFCMDIAQALRSQVFGNLDLLFNLASFKPDLKAHISKNLLFWQVFKVSLEMTLRNDS